MINIFNKKLSKIFLLVAIFILSLTSFVYAEDEVPISIDIYKNYEGWYKNWLIECGAVRVTLRNIDGAIVADYYVLPKQHEGNTSKQRILNADGAANLKDSEGREILFIQKNEGNLDLNDYGYKGLERKYSDNIPQLAKRIDGNDNKLPYIYFNAFSEYTTMESWEAYNNGENVNKLADDLGLTSFSEGKVFYEWLKTANADGMTPSLELQPVCLYPESTEQIYCNDFYTARSYGMQWNSDCGAYFDEMEKTGKYEGFFGWIVKAVDVIRLKLLAGKGKLLVYYDCGVITTSIIVDRDNDNPAYRYSGINPSAASDIERIITQDIETPKYVILTYTESTTYRKPWNERGFWKNKQKVDHSKYYTKDEIEGYYISEIIRVNEEQGVTFKKTDFNSKQDWYNYFNKWKDKEDEGKLVYYISFDSYCEIENWQEAKSGEHSGQWRRGEIKYNEWWDPIGIWAGIGDSTLIKTDHNKYTTIINGISKTLDKLLTIPDFECTALPKYGAGLIPMVNVATASQILFKFHSNLEQVGKGPGSIDEDYNLIGTIGSKEYT